MQAEQQSEEASLVVGTSLSLAHWQLVHAVLPCSPAPHLAGLTHPLPILIILFTVTVEYRSYSGTFENIETGTCSDIQVICNFLFHL